MLCWFGSRLRFGLIDVVLTSHRHVRRADCESEARRECDRQLGNLTPLETLEAVKNKTRFASIASEAWARVDKSKKTFIVVSNLTG